MNARLLQERNVVTLLGMGNEVLDSTISTTAETLAGDTARRRMMSRSAKGYIDGRGMVRIIGIITALLKEKECLTA